MAGYYLVNPLADRANGISTYVERAHEVLVKAGIEAHVLDCPVLPLGEGRPDAEAFILDQVGANDVVEVPDSRALFFSACPDRRPPVLHVRLHGPIAYLEFVNRKPVNWARWNCESRLAESSPLVSSPTQVNVDRYIDCGLMVERGGVRVFPNPVPEIDFDGSATRDIDVIFLGRLERLKGLDLFLEIVSQLPPGLNVVAAGVGEEQLPPAVQARFAGTVQCVGVADPVLKRALLRRAKVCVVPSRFESFSMVAAEAVAAGCHVVAWSGSGIGEAFPERLVSFVPPTDVHEAAATVLRHLERPSFDHAAALEFADQCNAAYVSAIKTLMRESAGRRFSSPRTPTVSLFDEVQAQRAGSKRKWRKLVRDPGLFVRDFFKKLVKED